MFPQCPENQRAISHIGAFKIEKLKEGGVRLMIFQQCDIKVRDFDISLSNIDWLCYKHGSSSTTKEYE